MTYLLPVPHHHSPGPVFSVVLSTYPPVLHQTFLIESSTKLVDTHVRLSSSQLFAAFPVMETTLSCLLCFGKLIADSSSSDDWIRDTFILSHTTALQCLPQQWVLTHTHTHKQNQQTQIVMQHYTVSYMFITYLFHFNIFSNVRSYFALTHVYRKTVRAASPASIMSSLVAYSYCSTFICSTKSSMALRSFTWLRPKYMHFTYPQRHVVCYTDQLQFQGERYFIVLYNKTPKITLGQQRLFVVSLLVCLSFIFSLSSLHCVSF